MQTTPCTENLTINVLCGRVCARAREDREREGLRWTGWARERE